MQSKLDKTKTMLQILRINRLPKESEIIPKKN